MKNTVKTIFGLAALALVAAGCNVTDPRPTYVPEGDGVTFLQTAVSATSLVSGTTSYSIDLARSSADEALTVNLTGSIYASTDPETDMAADFKMPESVTFESGEYLAKITLDVSKMEVGVTYSGTISLSDGQECFNPNTATTSTTVRLAMDYNWVELGEAQWYDGFMLAVSNDNMNIQKCRMTKAEGFEIYRLYNPWPAAEVAEAWGDAMSASNDVPEYLQFTINEDGSIDWRNDVLVYGGQYEFAAVNTGYTYSDWNDDYVWYTSPTEVFGQPDETAVVMENILCFNYGVFSNGSGGSGYVSSSYLALPAFEGNLEDLFQ